MAPRFEQLHTRLAGFDSFFDGQVLPSLEQHEAERQRGLRPALLKAGLIVAGAIALVVLTFTSGSASQLFFFAAILLLIFGLSYAFKEVRKARTAGSSVLIEKVCGFLSLGYSRDVGDFPFERFAAAGLLPSYHRKRLEDRISGRHDGLAFDLIEAQLKQRRRSGKRTHYVTVFNGLLLTVDYPRAFQGRTLVTGDGGFLGNLLGGLFRKEERVSLEASAFEEIFEVYASDQVEARVLLTPTVMERLVALKEELGSTPRLGFLEQRLWLALPRKGNQFEGGGLFSRLTDEAHVSEALRELCMIFRILDRLALEHSASA